ncbi:MucB/RseB C-terminal domain-containing protein [Halopseudomonas nanhaiensis]|uniref:MucB/RseB C-terminal domain-containing protein n=1 Tax=Halopseudomonas nanhaiensis TaxID=2830842 RepID=UPI001CBCBF66|nr:MucB/RseB C-terminal domain-containing protein [Halopseudomonas nanhaiensis]UAW97718.1 MucB/RseB C-terminal domain-containing protein [Halopseudomonas nanhaiensis]
MPGNREALRWAGLACCLVPFTVSADEAQDWLEKMTEASGELSFHGAFVYERSGSFTTHQIWRSASDGAVTERLIQSDGPIQEWLRRDGRLVCSSTAGTGLNPHEASQPVDELKLLADSYNTSVVGSTRVSARPVTVLTVTPHDAHRYAYELYVDSKTGLLLKSLMIDDRGTLLERFQFAAVEIGEMSPEQLETITECPAVQPAPARIAATDDQWRPAWLPQGFKVRSESAEQLDDMPSVSLSRTYTDGLTRFSLFIEELGEARRAEDVRAQLGPTVAISRRLAMPNGTYLATLVGEIPAATAERIVASLLPMQGDVQ